MSFRTVESTPVYLELDDRIELIFYRLQHMVSISRCMLKSVESAEEAVTKEYAQRFELFIKQLEDLLLIIEPIKNLHETGKGNVVEAYRLHVPLGALKAIDEGLWLLESEGPGYCYVKNIHEETFILSIGGVTSILNEVVKNFEGMVSEQNLKAA